jgi:phosphomannomutase
LPATFISDEVRFPVDESRKFAAVDEVKERLKKEGARLYDIDGVRVLTPDGWWLLRASNTEALLVVRAEGKSEDGLKRLRTQLDHQLEASGLRVPAA